MADKMLQIYFGYRDGSGEDLKERHLGAFRQASDFEIKEPFVVSDAGNIRVTSNDIPGITGMSQLENYEYESDGDGLDLLYAPMVRYSITDLSLLQNEHGEERENAIKAVIDAVSTGYDATDQKPLAVVAKTPPHGYYIGEANETPFTAESLFHDEYQHLSWLSVFTPPMVRQYGRETLLSAPAWQIRELDDGAILIVCHDDTVDWQADCRATAAHVGLPWYEDIG